MVFKQMLEIYDLLDDIAASGERVCGYLKTIQKDAQIEVNRFTVIREKPI